MATLAPLATLAGLAVAGVVAGFSLGSSTLAEINPAEYAARTPPPAPRVVAPEPVSGPEVSAWPAPVNYASAASFMEPGCCQQPLRYETSYLSPVPDFGSRQEQAERSRRQQNEIDALYDERQAVIDKQIAAREESAYAEQDEEDLPPPPDDEEDFVYVE
jgi:hypothetical protein